MISNKKRKLKKGMIGLLLLVFLMGCFTTAYAEEAETEATEAVFYDVDNISDALEIPDAWFYNPEQVTFEDGNLIFTPDADNGVLGLKGKTFTNEVLTFKLKSTSYQDNWFGLKVRAQNPDTVGWSGDGYLIVLREDDLEVQKHPGGIVEKIPHQALEANQEHLIEISAVEKEQDIQVVLKIDGQTVADWVDKIEPITAAGYFNVSTGKNFGATLTFMPVGEQEEVAETETDSETGAITGNEAEGGSNQQDAESNPSDTKDIKGNMLWIVLGIAVILTAGIAILMLKKKK